MSLDSILEHILDEANAQRDKIIQETREKSTGIIQGAKTEAQKLYQEILDKERVFCEKEKQRLIVNARLESKKNLLKAKQELIGSAFEKLKSTLAKDKFKKQQVFQDKVQQAVEDIDFYLNKIRPDYEIEIARILFE